MNVYLVDGIRADCYHPVIYEDTHDVDVDDVICVQNRNRSCLQMMKVNICITAVKTETVADMRGRYVHVRV